MDIQLPEVSGLDVTRWLKADAELKKIPFMLIVGENEEKEGTLSVRRHGAGDLGSMKPDDFVQFFTTELERN